MNQKETKEQKNEKVKGLKAKTLSIASLLPCTLYLVPCTLLLCFCTCDKAMSPVIASRTTVANTWAVTGTHTDHTHIIEERDVMTNYYCKYCGAKYSSLSSLTAGSCSRHPNEKGKHALYEGSEKSQYYCMYCGTKYSSISSLTAGSCSRHPNGKGKHAPYEGSEKSQYNCKYCGAKYSSISSLTAGSCSRHPNGKGKHTPAL
jgi:DNA-directed RNA polymerase subunit RPC12/RpoP